MPRMSPHDADPRAQPTPAADPAREDASREAVERDEFERDAAEIYALAPETEPPDAPKRYRYGQASGPAGRWTPDTAPRCPQCRYSLFGLTPQTPDDVEPAIGAPLLYRCPECGLEISGETLSKARSLADDSRADRRAGLIQEWIYRSGLTCWALGGVFFLVQGRLAVHLLAILPLVLLFTLRAIVRGGLGYPIVAATGAVWLLLAVFEWWFL